MKSGVFNFFTTSVVVAVAATTLLVVGLAASTRARCGTAPTASSSLPATPQATKLRARESSPSRTASDQVELLAFSDLQAAASLKACGSSPLGSDRSCLAVSAI